jgi:hypothetical protein
MSNIETVADLEKLFAENPTADRIQFLSATLKKVPALVGKFANVTLIQFNNCEIEGFDEEAFQAGSANGKVDVEFSYTKFDNDALFEKALVHGLGNWLVQDYGWEYQRDARWKRLPQIGADGLGDETFRRAAYAVLCNQKIEATDGNLRLLDHSKKPIRDKAAAIFDQSRKSPLVDGTLTAGAKVVVLGTPLFHEKAELATKLEALGLKVVKALKDATAVLVLPKPGAKLEEALAKKLPLLLEGHLRAGGAAAKPGADATAPEATAASTPKAATASEAENLEKLLFSGDAKNTLLGLSLAKARALEGDFLGQVVAVAFFSEDAAVRKEGRTLLLGHAPELLRSRLQGDKRNYFSLTDGDKLTKLAVDLQRHGVPGKAFTIACLRLFAGRDQVYGGSIEPALEAALALHPGEEPSVFDWVATQKEIYLPYKKTLPKGLSKLQSLEYLRIQGRVMANDSNFAELAALPKPIRIDYWVKDTKLAYFRKCAQNIASISFRGSFSNLSDISEMKNFTKLEGSDLSDTEIPDLEPLRDLPLTWLRVARTPIASLEPLRGKTGITYLDIDNFTGDLAPVATLVNLTNLSAMGTKITDLSLLAPLTKLTQLSLQTTAITDLKPLIGKPLTHLTISHLVSKSPIDLKPLQQLPHLRSLYLYGTKVDEAEVASLQKALPNLYISR